MSFSAPGSTVFGPYFTLSVSGNRIKYTYNADTTWSASATSLNSGGLYIDNGSLVSFTGAPAITSVTIDPTSQLGSSGFSASGITFNSGSVAATWMNEPFAAGNTVILDVNAVNAVPEPATWAMMLTGVGVVGGGLRMARRKNGMSLIAA